ncbi:MAG TPA: hypothetical protein VFZ99_05365 [Terriglobales bacterium]
MITKLKVAALVSFLFSGVAISSGLASAKSESREEVKRPYALLYGTVYDSNNHLGYGVKVKIRRADEKKAKWELYSDHRGEVAQRVPAGKADYIVWADVKTPKGQPKPQTTVHVENDERQDFSLHLP